MPSEPPSSSSASPQPLDAELLNRIAAQQDRTAFSELVRRHQERVWTLAYRVTHRREEADDITQETFLKIWRAAAQYTPTAKFSTWLHRVVVNLCIDFQRRRKPHLALVDEKAGPEPALLEAAERAECVSKAVGALPERQRLAVVLHRYEGLSYEEIAQATQWSQGAIESLLSRAYASLRQALREFAPEPPFSAKETPGSSRSTHEARS